MLAKEDKRSNWHSLKPGQVLAPLIHEPVPGDLLAKLKTVCVKFENSYGIKVEVCPRAGTSVKTNAMPEPLRRLGCEREDSLPCKSPGRAKGDCENIFVTYKITCPTCLMVGKRPLYEGETGRNAFTRGLEHQQRFHTKRENSAL